MPPTAAQRVLDNMVRRQQEYYTASNSDLDIDELQRELVGTSQSDFYGDPASQKVVAHARYAESTPDTPTKEHGLTPVTIDMKLINHVQDNPLNTTAKRTCTSPPISDVSPAPSTTQPTHNPDRSTKNKRQKLSKIPQPDHSLSLASPLAGIPVSNRFSNLETGSDCANSELDLT